MARISWIGDTVGSLDETRLRKLVDIDEAVRIAREEDLGIEQPSRRVDKFVDRLPELFAWFESHHRDFPWRRTRDPWAVTVAEILLQRTRATTVEDVYITFLDRYPNVHAVASADRNDLFETVESLGFGNKRTRTLQTLAETIVDQHEGTVPDDLEVLLELPRIGPYTARACLCFAYGQPLALVDANIETVMQHVFGYSSARRAHKDQALYAFLDALIPRQADAARVFNLALLDLRVLVCANEPGPGDCPLRTACLYSSGKPG